MRYTHMSILFTFFFLLASIHSQGQNCLGTWKVIEDKSNEPACILKLYEENGKINGKLLKILKSDTKQKNPMCVNCTDDRKDKPVIGMEVVRGMRKKGKYWSGGRLLDPHTGKTYKCYLELVNKDKIKARGYIGISLLGRTQYWYREDSATD